MLNRAAAKGNSDTQDLTTFYGSCADHHQSSQCVI